MKNHFNDEIKIYGWYFQQFLKMGFSMSKYANEKYLIWDESTREEHIARIAWLVLNYNENYPIDIDFGTPSMDAHFEVSDGNHRLAAAYYLNKKYTIHN
jgi:hypothetical protein